MKVLRSILHVCFILIIITGCKKDQPVQNTVTNLAISNLIYNPHTVTLKQSSLTYVINGTIDFQNAIGGVALLRLSTSTGANVSVSINGNNQTNGTLTGAFQISLPNTTGNYTFDIWVVDNKGNISNKLQGTLQSIIDETGSTWSVVSQSNNLHKVIWAKTNYVAVGDNGKIITSTDGINWITRNSGTSSTLYNISWLGNQYIAVGSGNTILTSPDGVNWTTRLTGVNGHDLYAVETNGSRFIAAGIDRNNNKTEILQSVNGINWTPQSFSVVGGNINSICWNGTQFVAVGKVLGSPLLITSADGLNWINRSSNIIGGGIEFNDIKWSGTKLVAVGFGLTATSINGINWVVNNNISWGATGVAYTGNRFVASGINGLYSSADGINWIKTFDSPYPTYSICWSGLSFITVGFVSPIIMISPSL